MGYPRAALFTRCVARVAYNIMSVVKGALRSVHGAEVVDAGVSGSALVEEVSGTTRGMLIAIPVDEWVVFHGSGYNLIIGSNMTRELNDAYNTAKKRLGVVTSLPWHRETAKTAAKVRTGRTKRGKRGGGLIGRWRIVGMEAWDQDFVDEEVEGFLEFRKDGIGEFQFGDVHGKIDYREVERDGQPGVEFSWDGNDETVPAQGRGWAIRDGDEIEGRIFFHRGDESAFRAVRKGR